MTRGGFPGIGRFSGKWIAGSSASYDDFYASITSTMMSNIMGAPFAGSDICGFNGNTTADLCARWHVVGAF